MSTSAVSQIDTTTPSRDPARSATAWWWLVGVVLTSTVVLVEPAPTDLLFAVGALPFLVLAGISRQALRHAWLIAGIGLLAVANAISIPLARTPAGAVYYAAISAYMIVLLIVFATFVDRTGRRGAEALLTAFLTASLASAAVGLLAYADLIPHARLFFRDETMMRIRSTFKDPNVFSPVLVAAVIVELGRILDRGRVRLLDAAALALLGSGILLAFSRGGFVHLAVSLFVLLMLAIATRRPSPRLIGVAVIGVPVTIIALTAATALLAPTRTGEYLLDRMALQEYDSERFAMQREALAVAGSHPLGIGPGQFTRPRFAHDVHNLYLRIWAENGILGLAGLVVVAVGWGTTTWRLAALRGPHTTVYSVCFAIVTGVAVESLIIDTMHWRHLFLFLAIPLGLAPHGSPSDRESRGVPLP